MVLKNNKSGNVRKPTDLCTKTGKSREKRNGASYWLLDFPIGIHLVGWLLCMMRLLAITHPALCNGFNIRMVPVLLEAVYSLVKTQLTKDQISLHRLYCFPSL